MSLTVKLENISGNTEISENQDQENFIQFLLSHIQQLESQIEQLKEKNETLSISKSRLDCFIAAWKMTNAYMEYDIAVKEQENRSLFVNQERQQEQMTAYQENQTADQHLRMLQIHHMRALLQKRLAATAEAGIKETNKGAEAHFM